VFDHDDVVDGLAISRLGPFAVYPEVADSTKLCDFLAMASKKLVPMFHLHEPLEAAANVLVPSTVATEGIQVDPGDPIADKRNAFFSLVFRPVPPPILATPTLGEPVPLRRWPLRLVGVVALTSRSRSERML
jgi:hypothetical protein